MNDLKLQKNQFIVSKAEFKTGIVLNNEGQYFKSNGNRNEIYTIFEKFELAKDFAIKEVQKNPDIECWIQNFKSETVFCIDKNGERIIKNKDFF
ncbi:hypothetical protein [Flavobacterium reichenbachii]|uniref:Uncharacterized protein n=1 Tax=Flavobacterium reichenbachii TaxID=362418 RepID=A0A085ZSZ1_9FLAO|nr:hypothetical protein [Flavobacterium reichenbachii]KFF07555.1 hypothetical protein IW19_19505 [Flavobacterium reichenbachii]OXB14198.1 hypothetical protein B0A68_13320 [Flavobacterium reichenbachii]